MGRMDGSCGEGAGGLKGPKFTLGTLRKASPRWVPTTPGNVPAQDIENPLWPDSVASNSGVGYPLSFKLSRPSASRRPHLPIFCLPSQLICGLPSSSSSCSRNIGNSACCTPSFPISTTSLRPSYPLQAELCPELPTSKCSTS